MSSDYEWTDWIPHDGVSAPNIPIGSWVHVRGNTAECEFEFVPGVERWKGWYRKYNKTPCKGGTWDTVIFYRIRKPRGLTMLKQLIQGVSLGEKMKVTA